MGAGYPQQDILLKKIETIFNPEFKGDLELAIDEMFTSLNTIETIDDFTFPDIKPDQISKVTMIISNIIAYIHNNATKINSIYSSLKGEESFNIPEIERNRLIFLKKLLQISIQNSIPLANYFWHFDGKFILCL